MTHISDKNASFWGSQAQPTPQAPQNTKLICRNISASFEHSKGPKHLFERFKMAD